MTAMQKPVESRPVENFARAVYAATHEGDAAEVRRFSDAALGFSGRSDLGMLLSAHERREGTPEGARTLAAEYLLARDELRAFAVEPEALQHSDAFFHAQVAWTRDSLYVATRLAERVRNRQNCFSSAGSELLLALEIAGRDLERLGPVPIPPSIAMLLHDLHVTVKDTWPTQEGWEARHRVLTRLDELTSSQGARSPVSPAPEPVSDQTAIALLDKAAGSRVAAGAIEQLDGIVGPQRAAALLLSLLQEAWARDASDDRPLVLAALRKLDAMADAKVVHVGVTVYDFKVLSAFDPDVASEPLLHRFRALEGAVMEELRALPDEVLDLRAFPVFSEVLALAKVLVRLDGRWSLQRGEEPASFLVGQLLHDASIAPAVRAAALMALRELPLARYQGVSIGDVKGEILRDGMGFAACGMMASERGGLAQQLRELEEERFGPLLNIAARKARQDWADFHNLIARWKVFELPKDRPLTEELRSLSAHYDLRADHGLTDRKWHGFMNLHLWERDAAMLFGARLLAEHAHAGAAGLADLERRLAGGGTVHFIRTPGIAPEGAPQLKAIIERLRATVDREVGRLLLQLAAPAADAWTFTRRIEELDHYAQNVPESTARALPWLKTFHPSHDATLGTPRQLAMSAIDHTERGLSSRGMPVSDPFDPKRSWTATVGQQDRGTLPCVAATMFFSAARCLAR